MLSIKNLSVFEPGSSMPRTDAMTTASRRRARTGQRFWIVCFDVDAEAVGHQSRRRDVCARESIL
jgi:hypothetical protein